MGSTGQPDRASRRPGAARHSPDDVRRAVVRLTASIAGGSGHLVTLTLVPGSFSVTRAEVAADRPREATRYYFTGRFHRLSEFDSADDSRHDEPGEPVDGWIELLSDASVAIDSDGFARIEPWRVKSLGASGRSVTASRPAGPDGNGVPGGTADSGGADSSQSTDPLTPDEIDDLLRGL